jgi:hypothetical protein
MILDFEGIEMEKDGKRKLGMFLTLLVDITRWIICFAGAIVRLKSRRWRDGGAWQRSANDAGWEVAA